MSLEAEPKTGRTKKKDVARDPVRERVPLVGTLQQIQAECGYLPRERLEQLSRETGIPLADIYSVSTFFTQFSLKPKGKHVITVCTGTACHVRGAPVVIEVLKELLSVGVGDTTGDGQFTLQTMNCLGACALGPLVTIDGKYYGKMNRSRIMSVMEKYGVNGHAGKD